MAKEHELYDKKQENLKHIKDKLSAQLQAIINDGGGCGQYCSLYEDVADLCTFHGLYARRLFDPVQIHRYRRVSGMFL